MEKRKDFKVNNDPYFECTLNDEEMKNYLSNLENLKYKINKPNTNNYKICYFYERNGWCKYKSDCKYLHQKKKLNGYCLKKDKYNFSHIIEKQSSIANNKLILKSKEEIIRQNRCM
jgi:hypothetical protein